MAKTLPAPKARKTRGIRESAAPRDAAVIGSRGSARNFYEARRRVVAFAVLGELGRSGIPGSAGTYTWSGIFNTFFWVDPEEELVGVFMTQISPFGHRRLHQRFRALVYQSIVD